MDNEEFKNQKIDIGWQASFSLQLEPSVVEISVVEPLEIEPLALDPLLLETLVRVKEKRAVAEGWVNFALRMKESMLKDIDKALENTVGIKKTGWILQAIDEKLKK